MATMCGNRSLSSAPEACITSSSPHPENKKSGKIVVWGQIFPLKMGGIIVRNINS